MKRTRSWFALSLIFIILCGSCMPAAASETPKKRLTLMVYMCGSNLESKGGAGSRDLMEMAASGYDADEVNVLVMTGGSRRWVLGQPKNALCIYTPDGETLRMLEAFDLASMGESGSLLTLLDYGYDNYPADKYALIMWNHGGGPMNGVCLDELFDGDTMTMEELYTSLSASPFSDEKLEWIGFDACLMGSAEVASLMSPFAHYMIASEETEPGGGWDYSFLKGIEEDADGAATGERIIDGYFTDPQDGFVLTLSCVDLTRLAPLLERLDAMFASIEISSGNYALFSYAAANTRSFGKAADGSYSYDLIDLSALIDMLKEEDPKAAEEAQNALTDAVVCQRSSVSSGGLSVYHPYDNKTDYVESWNELYPALGFSGGYTDYISRFASYLFGKSEVAWDGLRSLPTDDPSVFALPLSDSQADSLSGAVMNILSWDSANGAYSLLCTSAQVSLEENVLYGSDPGKILAAADPSGKPLTGAIPFEFLPDGSFGIYVNYCTEKAADSEEAVSLIPVDTGGIRKDFGSYSFDTDEAGTSGLDISSTGSSSTASSDAGSDLETVSGTSLSELIHETALSVTPVSPLSAGGLSDTLTVPGTVSIQDSSLPVAGASGSLSLIHSTSGQGAAAIEPISVSSLASSESSSFTIRQAGSSVDLTALTAIGTQSFTTEEQMIDLTQELPSPEEAETPEVVHAWLRCSADEDGNIRIEETWAYDGSTAQWSTRNLLDPALYPVLRFPVSYRVPASEGDALTGFESWKEVRTDAMAVSDDGWSLAFVSQETDRNLCVSFQITDLQNRTYSSIPLLTGS